jgi:hypothetical protein
MAKFYVDITGVSQDYLDFLGYFVVYEDEEFKWLDHKGDVQIIDKARPRLFVDDMNDAMLLSGPFASRDRIPFPPEADDKKGGKGKDKDKS